MIELTYSLGYIPVLWRTKFANIIRNLAFYKKFNTPYLTLGLLEH